MFGTMITESVHSISLENIHLHGLLMFPERKSKLGFPAFREDWSSGRPRLLTILLHPLVDFGCREIECNEPFLFGMDHPTKKLISIIQIPAHQGKHFGEKNLTGDLLGLSPAGAAGTPGTGVPIFCPARTNGENPSLLIH